MNSNTLKIGLIGHGRMGKIIESLSANKGFEVQTIVTSKNGFNENAISKCDVLIDFSHHTATLENVKQAIHFNKNIVIGTTGWDQDFTEVKHLVNISNIGLLYSPNFSIGVLLFCKIVSQASALIQNFEEYDICGLESHHRDKVDIPSGTAKALGSILLTNFNKKKKVIYGNDVYSKDGIHFPSIRSGNDPGMHTIQFDSECDNITLTHTARNRKSFALGALQSAQWLKNKKGFFILEDLLEEIFNGKAQ